MLEKYILRSIIIVIVHFFVFLYFSENLSNSFLCILLIFNIDWSLNLNYMSVVSCISVINYFTVIPNVLEYVYFLNKVYSFIYLLKDFPQ